MRFRAQESGLKIATDKLKRMQTQPKFQNR